MRHFAHRLTRLPAPRRGVGLAVVIGALLFAACGDDSDVVIVAITRTPDAAATAVATSIAPLPPTANTATPAPGAAVTVPEAPENLLAAANQLVPYLAGGSADLAGCLPEVVDAWGFAKTSELPCVLADLDGDGLDEFALLVVPEPGGQTQPGDVWIFDSADEGYRLIGSARSFANAVLAGVSLRAADDLTGDGLPELVVSSVTCGAAVCTTDFLILSGHRGRLEDLTPDDIAVAGLESATIEDATEDGRLDLVLRGGTVSSAGAGPPRASRRTLYWSGLVFFVDEQPDPPRYLVHAIADADALFVAGDFTGARALYEQTAADTSLRDWKVEIGVAPGRIELVPYALFRAGLAALRNGESTTGMSLLTAATRGHESTLHGLVAATYRASLDQGRTAADACRLVETFLRSRSAEFAEVWDYGYANPEHTIAGICR